MVLQDTQVGAVEEAPPTNVVGEDQPAEVEGLPTDGEAQPTDMVGEDPPTEVETRDKEVHRSE